ncbi:MAG: type II toxin-antitoxin system VapC family toxin [Thermoanaerobaculia bacterium]|nr:type II toxin-antitoxin system VapC family toxin [Thermoanaerobaculia bacterium]
MRILLDTHCWLWMQVSPEKLSAQARDLLTDPTSQLYLSAASSWEIGIKWTLGKLALPAPPIEYVPRSMERHGVRGLAVEHRHTLHMTTFPLHHRDPFDRLLLAQAQLEKLALMTVDRVFADYEGIDLLWA